MLTYHDRFKQCRFCCLAKALVIIIHVTYFPICAYFCSKWAVCLWCPPLQSHAYLNLKYTVHHILPATTEIYLTHQTAQLEGTLPLLHHLICIRFLQIWICLFFFIVKHTKNKRKKKTKLNQINQIIWTCPEHLQLNWSLRLPTVSNRFSSINYLHLALCINSLNSENFPSPWWSKASPHYDTATTVLHWEDSVVGMMKDDGFAPDAMISQWQNTKQYPLSNIHLRTLPDAW